MTHWRQMMDDRPTLGAWDFLNEDGSPNDRVAKIKAVDEVTLEGIAAKGIKKNKKPVLTLEDARGRVWKKKLVTNVSICETIASLYGNDVRAWPGKLITLYATTTRGAKGGTVECVRVRPERPQTGARTPNTEPQRPVDEAMRERQIEQASGPTEPAVAPREPGSDDT